MAEKQSKPKAIKPTHNQQLRQLMAENIMLKQRLIAADKEQRSLDYWKAIVRVVIIEIRGLEKDKMTEGTTVNDLIDHIATNIVKELTEREKAMKVGESFNEKKQEDDKAE